MQPWSNRVVEEANLFNPAFCATLLAKTTEEFSKKANQLLPFALAFLVLPIVLHRGTRLALPGSTITSLLPWMQDNREQLVDFAVRVQRLCESPVKRSCSACSTKLWRLQSGVIWTSERSVRRQPTDAPVFSPTKRANALIEPVSWVGGSRLLGPQRLSMPPGE